MSKTNGQATALNETQRAAEEQFSRQSKRYGKGHVLEDVADVVEALEQIALPARAAVLDVACGAGHTGLCLAARGHEVTCGDLSAAMLERTGEAATERGLSIRTQQHTAEQMPYEDGSFDLVTCRVAPHHFSDSAAFVREVARVLKPGGWFLLIDGTVPDDEEAAGEWLNRVEKLRDPSHVRLLSAAEWRRHCDAAGLGVKKSWLRRKQQPDLQWYFETAATSPENRAAVLQLIATADARTRELYELREDEGRIVWEWPMLSLVAQK
jgi:ubiquinone/menaquinone biosynthesis C-methylase UbiE